MGKSVIHGLIYAVILLLVYTVLYAITGFTENWLSITLSHCVTAFFAATLGYNIGSKHNR